MKVLITGGAGFLGSQLGYDLHNNGNEVILVDDLSFGYRDNLTINGATFGTFILDDIRNPDFGKYLDGVDVVIHFAAISALPVNQSEPMQGFSVNVAGWVNVLECCRKAKISKVIFASTSAVYENNTTFPFFESDIVNPHLVYSMTKKHAEEMALSYVKLYGMDISLPRFFNLYGPHCDYRRKSPPLISYIIKSLMLGERPVLHSDGLQKRDYVYVKDVCNICKLLIETKNTSGEIFNVASNSTISMNDIYNNIAELLQSDIKPIFRAPNLLWDRYTELNVGLPLNKYYIEKETNKFSQGSYDKAKNILGWEPKISFKEGIRETVEYAKTLGL